MTRPGGSTRLEFYGALADGMHAAEVARMREPEHMKNQREYDQGVISTYEAEYTRLATQIAELRDENERLRAVLAKIEAGYEQRLSAAELASMARQAL